MPAPLTEPWLEPHLHAFRDLTVLVAALDLGLETALPGTVAELDARTGTRPGRIGPLLDALHRLAAVTVDDGVWSLTAEGTVAFSRGTGSLRPMLGAFRSEGAAWLRIAATLRSADPAVSAPWPPWAAVDDDAPEPFADKTAAIAREVAECLPLQADDDAHIVDFGCGAGAFSRALLDRYPRCRVTLLDREPMVAIAERNLADHGDRLEARGGDILADEPTADADLVLVSNVLHSYDPEGCRRVLGHALRLLRPGGLLAVKDLAVDRTGALPRVATDFNLNMALLAPERTAWPALEVMGWIADAGCRDARIVSEFSAATGCWMVFATA